MGIGRFGDCSKVTSGGSGENHCQQLGDDGNKIVTPPADLPMGYESGKTNFKRKIWFSYKGFWSSTRISSFHSCKLSPSTSSMPGGRPRLAICMNKVSIIIQALWCLCRRTRHGSKQSVVPFGALWKCAWQTGCRP